MKTGTGKSSSLFVLETLEERILLSADPSSLATPSASQDSQPAIVETQSIAPNQSTSQSSSQGNPAGTTYDPAGQVSNIFDGATALDQGSQGTADTGTESPDAAGQRQTETSSSSGDSEDDSCEDTAPPQGASPDVSSPMAERLTQTLRSACGPPTASGSSLHLTPDEVLDLGSDGGLLVGPSDTLSGSGTICGDLLNYGFFSPGNSPGVITIENSFTQGAEGTTLIEIGGVAGPGVNPNGHDQINVLGDITLDGTIQIALFNGFLPSAGQSYVILHWTGTRTGEIANWLGTAGIPTKPDLAIEVAYNDIAKTLTLNVVNTPTFIPAIGTTINGVLGQLQQIGNAITSVGELAESLPFIGDSVGSLVDVGQGIQQAIVNQLTSILNSTPRQAHITELIENWDGTSVGGGVFDLAVKGVLGHYGAAFWWDVTLEITQQNLNQLLESVLGGVFNALFDSPPEVDIEGTLILDFSFGYDGANPFIEIDSLTARITADASGTGGLAFDLTPPGSPLTLDVTNWSIEFEASVAATPDPSILTGGRITTTTLGMLTGGGIALADAFNLDEGGTVDASFTLDGGLGLAGAINYLGTHTVRIESSDIFSGNDPDLTVVIVGSLEVLGQSISGTFTFKKTATETVVEMENGVLELSAGPIQILRVTNGTGKFLLLGGDLAGTASLTIAEGPDLPNIDISGTTLNLRFNTSPTAVASIDGETVDLPAGDYFRLAGNATITLTIPSVSFTGDFVFEPRDADSNTANGYEQTAVGVANASFQFDDGFVATVQVTDGSGAFLFTDDGMLGWATAVVTMLVPGISIAGTFTLTVNDTNSGFGPLDLDVNGTTVTIPVLPSGPYVRVTGTGPTPGTHATLTVLGIEISGDFVLEQKTTADSQEVVTVGLANVALPLGTLTADLLTVTNGSGAFIITDDGVAGHAMVTVGLNVPGVTLSGVFRLAINTTEDDVDETVDVVGTSEHIDVPGGPYLQINGTGVMLSVLGVSMTGNLSFEQRETEDGTQLVTLMASNLDFDFGTDLITLTDGEALFLFTDDGMAGKGQITAGINAFGMGFSHTFDWDFNNTNGPIDETVDWEGMLKDIELPAGPYNRIDTGGPVSFSIPTADATLAVTAELVLTLVDGDPDDYATIGVSSLTTTLAAGPLSLLVSGGTGAMVLTDDGLAGIVSVDSVTLTGASAVSVMATDLRLEFNSTGNDIDVTVPVSEDAAEDVRVQFTGAYYHDYLAVAGVADIVLTGFVTLTGNFRFEKSESNPNAFKLGASDLMLDLQAGSLTVLSVHNGSGAFLISSAGLAGVADVEFEVGLIGMSGAIDLEVNTTSAAVHTSVVTPTGTTNIDFNDIQFLRLRVDGNIEVGSFSLPFQFTVQVNTGTGQVEFKNSSNGDVLVSIDSGGGIHLGTALSSLTNIDFSRPNPFEFVSMLRQLLNWMQIFSESDLFDIEIPFTDGTTLGEVFDWASVFMDKIYSHMNTVELQSSSIFESTVNNGALSGARMMLQIGDEAPEELTVTDNIGNVNQRNGTQLVQLLNNAITASALAGRIEARINSNNERVVIALLPAEIAQGRTLKMVDLETQIQNLGFGPKDTVYGDADDLTAEQTAVETERYSTEEFFVVLADLLVDDILNGNGGVMYEPARRVYTYTVDKGAMFSTNVPFNLGADLGDIAGAELSGELLIEANAGFHFTLGFDLGAAEVPRILSSSLVPVPANGRISEDAHFQVFLNNDITPINVTLPLSYTNGTDPLDLTPNNSIRDLAIDLNRVFKETTYTNAGVPMMTGVKLDQLLYAQKAGNLLAISALNEDYDGDGALGATIEDTNGNEHLDAGEDVDGDGFLDRVEDVNGDMGMDNRLGVINHITIRALQDDVFATELGFGIGSEEVGGVGYFTSSANSPIKGLFVENIGLSAELSISTVTPISGALRFGFVEIATSGGVVETPTDLTASISLQDASTGDGRLYFSELMNSLASINIGNMISGPDFAGSFRATLSNITVGTTGGFSLPLGSSAEIGVFIPDINDLDFNADPYNGSNTGIFLTYPDFGHLTNFSSLNFTQIIQALNLVADSLSELSAFSFLDEPLPLIDVSVNDLLDYATKFAELIDAAASGNSQSIQETLLNLESQIEDLFDLDPNILNVSVDTDDATTAGANGSSTPATATINPGGYNNGVVFTATNNNTSLNGVIIRYVSDAQLTGDTAEVDWNATAKTLTIRVNGGVTTADAVVSAITGAGVPWSATLLGADNPTSGNDGNGTFTTVALKFSFVFTTGYANTLPFQLNLHDMVEQLVGTNSAVADFLDAVTTFIQVEGSGVLTVSASAALTLDFGLDLTDQDSVKPFFYDTTGVLLTAKVLGTDIEFTASIGAIAGIKIKEGTVTVDKDGNPETDAGTGDRGAEFRLGLRDNNGDGRHYFSENWLDFDNIDLHMEGGVSAVLPVFLVVGSADTPLGSDADGNDDGYPDNYLVVDIPDLVRIFVDTSATPNTLGQGEARLRLPGVNNNMLITRTAGDSDDFTVRLQEGVGAPTFAGNTLTIKVTNDTTTAQQVQTAVQGLGGFSVTPISPDDPAGGNSLLGTVTTSKLILITPDIASLFADLDMCDVINQSAPLLLDGLDALLGTIQDGLAAVAYNVDLPLIGDGFAGAADFIGDFRNGLLADLRTEIAEAGSVTAAIENAIKKVFWELLGPPGLNVLVDAESGEALDPNDGYGQLDVTLDCDEGLRVNLRLKKEIALVDTSSDPIDFEIGIPGFGLEVDGNVKLAIGFDLKLGFGFNKEDGFFFDSSAPADDPELRVYITATIPGLTATGTLLFLQLQVSDKADDPSMFGGQFIVDVMDPNNDGKLTFAELTSSGTDFEDVIHADLIAEADINLALSASFGGNTAFPRVVADLLIDARWSLQDGAETPTIAFTNVALDLGTFLSDFLGPILAEIQKVTAPFQPIIDVVTARLPVLSDLAGETITLLDLAEVFGLLEPSTVDFIRSVLEVVELINSLEGLGEGSILIPMGAFSLGNDESGNRKKIEKLQNAAAYTAQALQDAINNPDNGGSSSYSSQVSGFASDVGSLDNFKLPWLDNPSELFNLFIGEPVSLVEWRMPQFKFEFTYTQKIPIYPPLYAQFGGRIGATIDIGFGYDTFGIQKFISSEDKNPIDILDGFYVIDFDANGAERPELSLRGELFAGATIDLVIVSVGVNGGVFALIEFDLNDVNDDGKIRVSEIIALAEIDPRCIFNIHGEIGLFLEAFLKVDLFFFSIEKTWRFAEITLLEFDITCPEPILADYNAGTKELTLNVGSRAGNRAEIDTSDGNERFIVVHSGGGAGSETVEVQWGNFKKEFTNVGSITIEDAGEGDDYLDFRGILSPIDVSGGAGNDTIFLGDGVASIAHGGKGNDTITASSLAAATGVMIFGDEGNDTLTAGPAAIEIHGGAGNDTITGSPESDNPATFGGLYGEDGNDTITAGDGDDYADGGAGNDTVEGDEGNDHLLGGTGNDSLLGRRGDDLLEGGDGDDELLGSSGYDLLVGGLGNDYANGHGGIDILIGDNYSSIRINGTTLTQDNISTLLPTLEQFGLSVFGISGDGDNNTANDGDDLLVGGGNIDALFGGEGDDQLYGGNLFNDGESGVIEEDHNDFFDGGPGNDVIFGDDAMGRTGDRNTGIAIKSSVFFDANENGRRDTDELGLGGILVQLYLVGDIFVTDTTTESDGAFEFVGLDPGSYYMRFTNIPTGLSFTLLHAPPPTGGSGASNPDDDADDNDAYLDLPASGRTALFGVDFNETESAVAAGFIGPAKVSVANVSVEEGNSGQTALTFTVMLSHLQGAPVEIDYTTVNLAGPMGASTVNGDYELATGTVLFNPGETTKLITVLINGDTTYEEHQQFELDITRAQRMEDTPVNLQVTSTQILGTIINDDDIPSLSVADYEPPSTLNADGTRTYLVGEDQDASFEISLSNPSQYAITVLWRSDASYGYNGLPVMADATPEGFGGFPDFRILTDQLVTFLPGQVRKVVSVPVFDESEKGLPDYDEPEETFYVELYSSTKARIQDGRAYGIIADDDDPVSASIFVAGMPGVFTTSKTEGTNGSVFVTLEVRLSAESGHEVVLTYATSPGTAVESVFSQDLANGIDSPDYVSLPDATLDDALQTLIFRPGEPLSQFITVEILPDNRIEGTEMFFVNLIDSEHAEIAANAPAESNHVTIEIHEDDVVPNADLGPWSIRFSDVMYMVNEPDTGTVQAAITIVRNPGSHDAVAVFYTLDGTATSSGLEPDYDSVFRQLVVFAPNEYSKTVFITVHSDDNFEGDETVRLYLRAPTGQPTPAYPNQATLVIKDGDVPSLVIFAEPIFGTGLTEGSSGGTTNYSFFVVPVDENGVFVTVPYNIHFDYRFISLTARNGVDFFGVDGLGVILANDPFVEITYDLVEDTLPELTEKLALRISNPQGATVETNQSAAVATVFDDDPVEIFGVVFYDNNGNGFRDVGEKSIKDVDVAVTYFDGGVETTAMVKTDQVGPGGDWVYKQDVFLGQVSITVDPESVTSPFQGFLVFLLGSGNYETTTNNENQTIAYDGVVGISPFESVGYKNSFTFAPPAASDDVGRGGTDDTIFGGPGNDIIDAGAGDDHVVGGHWMTATDGNLPVNTGSYDAIITVTQDLGNPDNGDPESPPLHNVYDQGPIFAVDTSALSPVGSISGEIWLDNNDDGVQQAAEPLFTLDFVIVNLFDGEGNWVNSLVTNTGTYNFNKLILKADGTASIYLIQFELASGYKYAKESPGGTVVARDNDGFLAGRTMKIHISKSDAVDPSNPNVTNIDVGFRPSDLQPASGSGSFTFADPSYYVAEDADPAIVTLTIIRGDSTKSQAVAVRTRDGTALANVNYSPVRIILNFDVGETIKTVSIPIIDADAITDLCSTLVFYVDLFEPTGRPFASATVFIYGEGAGEITDDDIIDGGDDWDIILGDSGNIPAPAVIATPTSLATIETAGGPGKDVINGGDSTDYIDGQIGDDILAGNAGRDLVFGGLGNDIIIAERSDDVMVGETLNGGFGFDTIVSERDVALTQLFSTGATTADLWHRDSAAEPLALYHLIDIEMAQLYGGFQDNTFDLKGWNGSSFVVGRTGNDTLLVTNNVDLTLKDASFIEGLIFQLLFGFTKHASVVLPDATYHLSSIENVTLTGGASNNKLDASGFSRAVTLIGLGGDDELIGGSNNDTFVFDADDLLGTDTVTGNGGRDTLYFGYIQVTDGVEYETLAGIEIDLSLFDLTLPPVQTVEPGKLKLQLKDAIENVTGGTGDDEIIGNDLNNVLLGGPGDDSLTGGPGSEIYVFDTDADWGTETIVESISDFGQDVIDFSGTTTRTVSLNLSILNISQTVNDHLDLIIVGEGVEEVRGGSLNDVLRGNSNNNTLRGGPGADILDGKSGNDTLDGGTGNDDLNGGPDSDTINEVDNTSFVLTNNRLVRGTGEIDLLDNIEVANLTGGVSGNTFTLTGWTGQGKIQGLAGFDMVILAADTNFTLTNASLQAGTGLNMGLNSIEHVTLSAGPGANTFDTTGFTGGTSLTGAEGNDIFKVGPGSDLVDGGGGTDSYSRDLSALPSEATVVLQDGGLLVTWLFEVSPGVFITLAELDLFVSVESVSIIGTPLNDTFDVSAWNAGAISVNGGAGVNLLTASVAGNVMLTNSAVSFTGGVGTIAITQIQQAILTGSAGPDIMNASAFTGQVWLKGGAGNDLLVGGAGDDILQGDEGDDTMLFIEDGVLDSNFILGGDGIDTLSFAGNLDLGINSFASGVKVDLSLLLAFQTPLAGDVRIALFAEDVENILGGDGADTLIGNSLNNRFTGGAGADTIIGMGGSNTLAETADPVKFTLTNLSLDTDGVVDTLTDIQTAELTGGDAANEFDATGFSGIAILSGGGQADVLRGGTGVNLLIGGAGDDILKGNTSSDNYRWDADEVLGSDTVDDPGGIDLFDFGQTETVGITIDLSNTGVAQAVAGANLSITIVPGAEIEFIIGSSQVDHLTGNAANNAFLSGEGNDFIDGRGGINIIVAIRDADMILTDSALVIGTETDALVNIQQAILQGGAGNNTMDASAFTLGQVTLRGEAGDDTLIGSRAGDELRGGDGADVLLGGSGNDTLFGEAGNDTLNGGTEDLGLGLSDDDTLSGGAGNDTYVFDLALIDVYGDPVPIGFDTVTETAVEGFNDVLVGIGLAGIDVDLWDITPQPFFDNDGNLLLTLDLSFAGTVEDSY